MKREMIFIDNEDQERAREQFDMGRRRLNIVGGVDVEIINDIKLIPGFYYLKNGEKEDLLFGADKIIFTHSMFTENHLGSYYQLAEYLSWAGITQKKDMVYCDTASYLKHTLERICDSTTIGQVGQIIRAIELNMIIGYDSEDSKFYRFRYSPNEDNLIAKEVINLTELLTIPSPSREGN